MQPTPESVATDLQRYAHEEKEENGLKVVLRGSKVDLTPYFL